MESNSKSKYHYESKSPSPSPPTFPLRLESLNPQSEVVGSIAAAINPDILEKSIFEPPEVESLIHKLQLFPISPLRFDKSQGNVTS